jgi:hypothetical protein
MYVLEKEVKLKNGKPEIIDLPNLISTNYIPYQIVISNDPRVTDLSIQICNKSTNAIICDLDKAYFVITNEIDLNVDEIKRGVSVQLKLKYTGNQGSKMLKFQIMYKKTVDMYKLSSHVHMTNYESLVHTDIMNDILKYENAKRVLITADTDIKSIVLRSKFSVVKGKLWDSQIVLYHQTDDDPLTVATEIDDTEKSDSVSSTHTPHTNEFITKHENSFTYELNYIKFKNSRIYKYLNFYDLEIETRSSNIYVNIYGLE